MDDVVFHGCTVAMSGIFGYVMTHSLIPVVADYLSSKKNLNGIDMGRRDRPKVPESLGIVVGLTYLASFVLFFMLLPYLTFNLNIFDSFSLSDKFCATTNIDGSSGYNSAFSNIAAITSITAMLILGFIDDCYDLRWRYKLMFPFAASIPLLSVYYYNYRDRTTVLIPQFVARALGLDGLLNLGVFYYLFMLMFVIFCTNAINIYAGINGLEILIPFLMCSSALYKFNRYPAKVFVGDSYCYFAGMTLAVVGILGHFSEEILLFAIPQVFNFLLSVPQIFKIIPCPRHRLPKFNEETGLREPSTFIFQHSKLGCFGKFVIKVYSTLGLAMITEKESDPTDLMAEKQFVSNNLTLINLWLCWFGPRSERDLCHQLLRFQSWLSFLALAFLTVKINYD